MIGIAPTTWASVSARIIAAAPLVSPVSAKATSANATGPAACGTANVAEEMYQRSRGSVSEVVAMAQAITPWQPVLTSSNE